MALWLTSSCVALGILEPVVGELGEVVGAGQEAQRDGPSSLGHSPSVDHLVFGDHHQPRGSDLRGPTVSEGDHRGVEHLGRDIPSVFRAESCGSKPVDLRQHLAVEGLELGFAGISTLWDLRHCRLLLTEVQEARRGLYVYHRSGPGFSVADLSSRFVDRNRGLRTSREVTAAHVGNDGGLR
jgi:hypothetical protein